MLRTGGCAGKREFFSREMMTRTDLRQASKKRGGYSAGQLFARWEHAARRALGVEPEVQSIEETKTYADPMPALKALGAVRIEIEED